jgi:DNA polymerase-3 subunit delta
MDALAFLNRPPTKAGSLYVLPGDEPFLKRHVIRAIRVAAVGADADDQAVAIKAGETATFAEVFDELETLPFFFPRRLVVVDNADPFVTEHRAELERKVGSLPATGTLVLDVKTWPANTKLAKLVDTAATIVCKAPGSAAVAPWCSEWAQAQYGKQLPAAAARLLAELIGPELGLLDQELAKLAVYVGKRNRIDAEDVDRLVGQSRMESTFKVFDAVAAGNTQQALAILHQAFEHGEDPYRILGAFGVQLRKLQQAYRLTERGVAASAALSQVGVPPFAVRGSEQQMRHLGRRRLERLYDWLLQMYLDLRGNSPLPPRTLFDRLVIRLARSR